MSTEFKCSVNPEDHLGVKEEDGQLEFHITNKYDEYVETWDDESTTFVSLNRKEVEELYKKLVEYLDKN